MARYYLRTHLYVFFQQAVVAVAAGGEGPRFTDR